jgi:hypothetical protein
LFIDETFLEIRKKTWYLIMAITDTVQILAMELFILAVIIKEIPLSGAVIQSTLKTQIMFGIKV